MSTSPTEKTLASGMGRGSTNTSPSQGSAVPGPISAELLKSSVGMAATP